MKFNFDNRVFAALGKLVDCVILCALWLLFCIPVFTIGASTTALYYTVHKSVARSRGYVYRSFWSSFKSNFKQSTLMWLIMMVIYLVLYFDLFIMSNELANGGTLGPLYYVFLVLTALAVVWNVYIFAYSARFENTKKATMRNAAVIATVNFGWSLLILVLLVVAAVIVYLLPVLIFLVPAALFLLYDLILERIFRRYMSEEDLAKEKENDMLDRE
jgi:uncharacterized membrane protein YesL